MHRSALLFTLLFAAASVKCSAEELASGPLMIVLRMDRSTPAPVIEGMQREVEYLLEPSAISVAWRRSAPIAGESFARVAVMHLRGECRADAPASRARFEATETAEALG